MKCVVSPSLSRTLRVGIDEEAVLHVVVHEDGVVVGAQVDVEEEVESGLAAGDSLKRTTGGLLRVGVDWRSDGEAEAVGGHDGLRVIAAVEAFALPLAVHEGIGAGVTQGSHLRAYFAWAGKGSLSSGSERDCRC